MKPKATDKKVSLSSPMLIQIIRKSIIIYLLSAVILPAICFIFGFCVRTFFENVVKIAGSYRYN